MSLVKRLTATIRAQVDAAVSRIEDHDAVIDAAIAQARQALAKGRVRLARVQRDGQGLTERAASLRAAITSWELRARRVAAEDENKALECLRRRNDCQAQLAQVEETLTRHRQLQQRLEQDVRQAEERLAEHVQQRNLMRTRSSTAEALRAMSGIESDRSLGLDAAFERWEIRMTEAEMEAGVAGEEAGLEREFKQAEDRERLRAELDELLKGKE